jgi:phosphatidylglycerol:prolipoprotein diacylglycerol transferase
MYGGLILAVPFSTAVLPALAIPFGAFWDVASFTMLVGMIVTRVGCFLNGCCAGRRFPTQLLEAGWGIVVLAGACLLWRRLPFAGALFLYTIGSYGAGRIVLQTLRAEPDRLFGLPLQRVLSAALVAISAGAFAAWEIAGG